MKVCENCGENLKGIYDLDFGFVCFHCYEEIRQVFDLQQFNYPKCKNCEKELTTILEMEYEICSKCLINDIKLFIERSDKSCSQQEC
jgi:ribosomal protein L34E